MRRLNWLSLTGIIVLAMGILKTNSVNALTFDGLLCGCQVTNTRMLIILL
jgi:hypothetical protein